MGLKREDQGRRGKGREKEKEEDEEKGRDEDGRGLSGRKAENAKRRLSGNRRIRKKIRIFAENWRKRERERAGRGQGRGGATFTKRFMKAPLRERLSGV